MNATEIENEIRSHLEKNGKDFKSDTNLFEADIIDSMGVMELIIFIEDDIGIIMDQSDLTLENFDTFENIVKTVLRYKK